MWLNTREQGAETPTHTQSCVHTLHLSILLSFVRGQQEEWLALSTGVWKYSLLIRDIGRWAICSAVGFFEGVCVLMSVMKLWLHSQTLSTRLSALAYGTPRRRSCTHWSLFPMATTSLPSLSWTLPPWEGGTPSCPGTVRHPTDPFILCQGGGILEREVLQHIVSAGRRYGWMCAFRQTSFRKPLTLSKLW